MQLHVLLMHLVGQGGFVYYRHAFGRGEVEHCFGNGEVFFPSGETEFSFEISWLADEQTD